MGKEKENQIIQLVKLNGLVTDSIHLHENNPQFKLPAKEAFEWDIGDKISLLNEFYDHHLIFNTHYQLICIIII